MNVQLTRPSNQHHTSYEMRRFKIVTWTVVLSIINFNFALGAPAAVREKLEMLDVAEGGITSSELQKRNDPLDLEHLDDSWSTTNAADRLSVPPSPDLSDFNQLWEELGEEDIGWHFPPTSESPGSKSGSTGSEEVESKWQNYGSSNPSGSHLGPTGGSPLSPLPHPGPEDRLPSPPNLPVNPDTSTGHQPIPPQRPTVGLFLPPSPLTHPDDRFPTPSWSVDVDLYPGTLSSTGHQPTPSQSPTDSPLPHPGSSGDRSPSPHCWLAEPDRLPSIGSQTTPPQSPGVIHSPPSPESSPEGFLDKLLKGKIKRRIYC